MTAEWHMINQTVFNANYPTSWTELNLAPWVGARRVWAHLTHTAVGGADDAAMKPSGDTDTWAIGYRGCSQYHFQAGGTHSVLALTDENGKIEHMAGLAAATVITLNGCVTGISHADSLVHSGAFLAGWNDVDASAVVAARAVAMLKTKSTGVYGVPDYQSTRPYGAADAYEATGGISIAHRPRFDATDQATATIAFMNPAGIYQYWETNGVKAFDQRVLSYVSLGDGFELPVPGQEIVHAGASPMAWTPLDISLAIDGAKRALVFLKMKYTDGLVQNRQMQVRENGLPYGGSWSVQAANTLLALNTAFVIVPTDAAGIIEWKSDFGVWPSELEVLGYIAAGPPVIRIVNAKPLGPTLSDEEPIRITSARSPEIAGSPSLSITSPIGKQYDLVVAGAVQTGYTGYVREWWEGGEYCSTITILERPSWMTNLNRWSCEVT